VKGNGRKALILGLGRFGGGREAARYLLRHGWRLRICDRSPEATLADSVRTLGTSKHIEWCLGRESTDLLDGIDLVVVNPAIPSDHPVLKEASCRAVPLTQEVALFLAAYPGQVVMVTGTNGKSSTSSLLASALRRGGRDTLLGGNIGQSLLAEEARWRAGQVAILEISSFQLERLNPARHRVHGAVITRIGRDHLDRHGDLSAYHAAKGVAAAAATQFLVHAADDPVATGFPSSAGRRVRFGTDEDADVGCDGGWVQTALGPEPGRHLHRRALAALGDFQLENAMAATAAAAMLGAPRHPTALALATWRGLPFRLRLLREVAGVRLYDNSVSTGLESTILAVRAVPGPVHWVGGGKSKDGDYARVAEALTPLLASAHLFGTASGPLASLLRPGIPVTANERLLDALAAAWTTARAGDAVLVSPGFTSFDQYPNFQARAEEFHRWARQLGGPGPAPENPSGHGAIGPQLAYQ
jgi:UDP-N-acetylmuramoylalanine--D-glutamate ligase